MQDLQVNYSHIFETCRRKLVYTFWQPSRSEYGRFHLRIPEFLREQYALFYMHHFAILLSLEVDRSGNPTGFDEELGIFSEDRVEDALQLGINDSMYFMNGGHRSPTGVKQCHAVSINPKMAFGRRV